MPELPEVETTRRGIEPLIQGKTVKRVLVHNASLRWPVSLGLASQLPGETSLAVERRSKYLLARFSSGTLIIHLGMTGHLRVAPIGEPLRKHDHVEIIFTDRSALRYNDSRRFGAIFWTKEDPLLHERLSGLGPEPFGEDFTAAYFYERSRGRSLAIKPFLMTAGVVVGVGNIYASEALFRAGIDPRLPAGQVSLADCQRLVSVVCEVLAEAIRAGGTTIRDFADSDGNPGYFSQELKVYGRAGEPCRICGAGIRQIRLGQRSTFFCPVCQEYQGA